MINDSAQDGGHQSEDRKHHPLIAAYLASATDSINGMHSTALL